MNNTELFDFRFVDREYEQNQLHSFLTKHNSRALWIRGNRGFGKTEFFNYVLKEHDEYALCYMDIKQNQNSIEILSDFIKLLQEHHDEDFFTTISRKYKYFYNHTYKQTRDITKEIFSEISKLVPLILDLGYYVVNKHGENTNSLELIGEYIKTIIKTKKICICIDNFSRCNIELAQHFFQIIKEFIDEENFKACIVTTTEDLQEEFKDAIFFQLPHIAIDINKFDKYNYFFQILEPIFKMESFSDTDLQYIYNKCEGSPKKLGTIIRKLLEHNGIRLFDHNKASIDKNKLFEILQKNHIKFDDSDFTPVQKWIIFSFLCLTPEIEVDRLKELALYISKRFRFYNSYNESLFDRELLVLIDNGILRYDLPDIISTYHDLDYMELMEIYNSSNLKKIFAQYTYEFLCNHKNYDKNEELRCKHSYEAETNNWETINFCYAKKLFHSKRVYDAYTILLRLDKSIHKLHPLQILFIGIVSYEAGNFEAAIKKMELLDLEKLRFELAQYYFLFYLGKSYNNIGKIDEAIKKIEKALSKTSEFSLQYVKTLNILHMFYFEVPGKLELSRKIFLHIQENYENEYPEVWANTMRGCQNFWDNTTSLEILQKAEKKLSNDVEKAFIKNTMGFVLVKENNLDDAKKHFEEACKIIKNLRIHEFSYVANNLAICYMIDKEYEKAKTILLEALFWNKTNYGELVLQTHLMICTLYLNQLDDAHYYYEFLKNYIEKHKIVDPIVKRKVYMNLAIYCSKTNNSIMECSYYEKARPFVNNSSSEWRYNILVNKIYKNEPPTKYLQTTTFEPWFLIYAHD